MRYDVCGKGELDGFDVCWRGGEVLLGLDEFGWGGGCWLVCSSLWGEGVLIGLQQFVGRGGVWWVGSGLWRVGTPLVVPEACGQGWGVRSGRLAECHVRLGGVIVCTAASGHFVIGVVPRQL